MEKRSLKEIPSLKERMGAQLKELNLNPKTLKNSKKAVKGFTDFIQNKETEETDNSYDNKEMCEYQVCVCVCLHMRARGCVCALM